MGSFKLDKGVSGKDLNIAGIVFIFLGLGVVWLSYFHGILILYLGLAVIVLGVIFLIVSGIRKK
jgi:hypothetical protein